MRSNAVLALVLSACALMGLSECSRESGRLSLSEAEALIRDFDTHLSTQLRLKEITTDEIWRRLHIQVFKDEGDFTTFVISNGRVGVLGTSFGGWGVTQMCVTDLDSNGSPELTYVYSWGSGLHRSHIAAYLPERGYSIEADIVYLSGDFVLDCLDDRNVIVQVGYYDWLQDRATAKAQVGRVILDSQAGKLIIELAGDLSPALKKWLFIP